MAREYSKTNLTIWQDPDYRALPWPAQHVYKMFWDHPNLSYCGVVDWRPGKMLSTGLGWRRDDFLALTDCLRARHYLVVDEDSEEVLVRSWVRFDGVMKQPRLAVSFSNAYADVGSNNLRGVIVHEMNRLREREPDLVAWTKPAVERMVGLPSIDPRSLFVPTDPFESSFACALGPISGSTSGAFDQGLGSGLDETRPEVSVPVSVPPTTATATAPAPTSSKEEVVAPSGAEAASPPPAKKSITKRPSRPLPDDWAPTDKHAELATELGVDLALEVARFRDHAAANDRRMVDWGATFSNWLRGAPGFNRGGSVQPAQQVAPAGQRVTAFQCSTREPHAPHPWEDARNRFRCDGVT